MLTPRDPFTGSPGFAVDYTATPDGGPAWPLLRPRFIGSPDGAAGLVKLGIEPRPGAQGGPVFDAGGRFVGIALRSPDGQDRLLASTPRVPVDSIYEHAMPLTLQVIAEP